jgi:hypothetical protein
MFNSEARGIRTGISGAIFSMVGEPAVALTEDMRRSYEYIHVFRDVSCGLILICHDQVCGRRAVAALGVG